MFNSGRPLALLAFICVSIAWGTTYAGMRVAVESIRPFTLAGMRFTFAGLVLMMFLQILGVRFPTWADWKRIIPAGFLMLTCANSITGWATQYIDSGFVGLMVNSGPILFVVLAAMAGDKIPWRAWLGLAVGSTGLVVLLMPKLLASSGPARDASDPHVTGALIALLFSPMFWSLGGFVSSRYPAKCHPIMSAAAQTAVGGLLAWFAAGLMGEYTNMPTPTPKSLWALLYLIVIGSWVGYVCYNYCLLHLAPQTNASIVYLNTVVAILVGVAVMGEKLRPEMMFGGVIIMAGVYLANTARAKKPSPAAGPVETPPVIESDRDSLSTK